MATVYGNTINGYWRVYLTYTLNNNYAQNKASIAWSYGINWVKDVKGNDSANNYSASNDRPTYVSCTGQTTQYRYPTATFTKDNSWAGRSIVYGSGTFYITKKTTTQSITVKALITHTPKSSSTLYKGTSSKSVTLTVSALPSYTISFDKNTEDTVTQMPSNMTKYYGVAIKLPPTTDEIVSAMELGANTNTISVAANAPQREGWAWQGWSDGTKTYKAGASYTGNANATLYAVWGATDPPTCDVSSLSFSTSGDNPIRGFTTISCTVSNASVAVEGRQITSITMQIGEHISEPITGDGVLSISGTTFTSEDDGEQDVYIITQDDAGAVGTYPFGTVVLVAPTWSRTVNVFNSDLPQTDARGVAILDSFAVLNTNGTYDNIDLGKLQIKPVEEWMQVMGDPTANWRFWTFEYEFDENHVDDPTSENPNTTIKLSYKHYSLEATVGNQAFYTTSRNQNYSNGIYNVMFVGGVDNTQFPDYTSRAWWSKINDPLYFPDTNYIEVGSNDTAVQGLTKVGDYLAVIKQSKTTDTAIFLLYPTSFEEETTYAVKQGVQGVGALSRYSFNILGDETLFLSPKGVMAIVPSQDDEHKVQNRSYFVDKRLLAETGVEQAYSFVHDGKYFLAIGNGHCYVLDGNQRNSWGNDRTVLVYECYYLDNIPATCFVKFKGNLAFSNQDDVCVFGDDYTDAYEADADTKEPVPVKAEWSTIFDDDGSLHYYKTMQKKGNLVSVLPLENETPYKQVTIDAETFNENKERYFIYDGEEYVQCGENDVFSGETGYFIENRSSTKIYVRKDDSEPVEIQRKFGLQSDTPSEMFLNKKFKKYKRLQFILRNEADENFGVDEIVKNYTLQNYAKK